MHGAQLSLPTFSPSFSRRSPSPLALPSPCRLDLATPSPPTYLMAQFSSPYANMHVPNYDSTSRSEAADLHDLNHRAFQHMSESVSMDGLEVTRRAEDQRELNRQKGFVTSKYVLAPSPPSPAATRV
ncbi:hypothetical protein JCM10212_001874 [Sporobolomyces blumeae]